MHAHNVELAQNYPLSRLENKKKKTIKLILYIHHDVYLRFNE